MHLSSSYITSDILNVRLLSEIKYDAFVIIVFFFKVFTTLEPSEHTQTLLLCTCISTKRSSLLNSHNYVTHVLSALVFCGRHNCKRTKQRLKRGQSNLKSVCEPPCVCTYMCVCWAKTERAGCLDGIYLKNSHHNSSVCVCLWKGMIYWLNQIGKYE